MRLRVLNSYTYTIETLIHMGHMNMRIGHVPVRVNPKTRESRLIPSIRTYIWRSASIVLHSYVTYKPLRTFLYCAVPPAFFGLAACLRFMYYFLSGDGSGHTQSLVLAAILLIVSFMMIVLGILADLISTNRRLIQEAILIQRKRIYQAQERRGTVPHGHEEVESTTCPVNSLS